jgi:hypothetical protein
MHTMYRPRGLVVVPQIKLNTKHREYMESATYIFGASLPSLLLSVLLPVAFCAPPPQLWEGWNGACAAACAAAALRTALVTVQ